MFVAPPLTVFSRSSIVVPRSRTSTDREQERTRARQVIPFIFRREENEAVKKKYVARGPNKCVNLQGDNMTIVKVNVHGQPKCRNGRKLSSYLGLLARDPKLIPFDLEDWRKFLDEQTKETLWKIILVKAFKPQLVSVRDESLVNELKEALPDVEHKLGIVPKEQGIIEPVDTLFIGIILYNYQRKQMQHLKCY